LVEDGAQGFEVSGRELLKGVERILVTHRLEGQDAVSKQLSALVIVIHCELVDAAEQRLGLLLRVALAECLKPLFDGGVVQSGLRPCLVPQLRPAGLDVLELALYERLELLEPWSACCLWRCPLRRPDR
jgi:hypothetical protein